MAQPFSAIPTPYRVQTSGGSYWANCAWDALNIAALLKVDARVEAHCPDCNAELSMVVQSGALASPEGIIHFVVPPRRFWENIGFT
jgi:alkylmercury lyase-like protein